MPKIEAPWAKVPLDLLQIPGITVTDIKTYVAIDYLAGKRGWWYGSKDFIKDRAGVSLASVERAIVKLVKEGYLEARRRGMKYLTCNVYYVLARGVEAPNEPSFDKDHPLSLEGINPSAMRGPIPQTSTIDLKDDDLTPNADQVINSDPRLSMSPRLAYEHTAKLNEVLSGVYSPDKYWLAWGDMNTGRLHVTNWQDIDWIIDRIKQVCPKYQYTLPSPSYLEKLEHVSKIVQEARPGPVYWAIRRFERDHIAGGDLLTSVALFSNTFLKVLQEEIESNPEAN